MEERHDSETDFTDSGAAGVRRRGWAWLYGAAIPSVFVALTAIGFAIGGNPTAVAFLVTPWTWVTALAVQLYRTEAKRAGTRRVMGLGAATRSATARISD